MDNFLGNCLEKLGKRICFQIVTNTTKSQSFLRKKKSFLCGFEVQTENGESVDFASALVYIASLDCNRRR